jgi:hypothetical protein
MGEREDAEDALTEAIAGLDPLRQAFGYAIASLVEHLPAGPLRDVAVAECLDAHQRATTVLRSIRRLH